MSRSLNHRGLLRFIGTIVSLLFVMTSALTACSFGDRTDSSNDSASVIRDDELESLDPPDLDHPLIALEVGTDDESGNRRIGLLDSKAEEIDWLHSGGEGESGRLADYSQPGWRDASTLTFSRKVVGGQVAELVARDISTQDEDVIWEWEEVDAERFLWLYRWSPDGMQLVTLTYDRGEFVFHFNYPASGVSQELLRLTEVLEREIDLFGGDDIDVVFSPGGEHLAIVVTSNGIPDDTSRPTLFLFDGQGNEITSWGGVYKFPMFSEGALFFVDAQGSLQRYDLKLGKTESVRDVPGVRPMILNDAEGLIYAQEREDLFDAYLVNQGEGVGQKLIENFLPVGLTSQDVAVGYVLGHCDCHAGREIVGLKMVDAGTKELLVEKSIPNLVRAVVQPSE